MNKTYIDQKYNKLTIIEEPIIKQYTKTKKASIIKCECECGNKIEIRLTDIKRNKIKSCGCTRRDYNYKKITHNLTNHPLYKIWVAIKTRCYNSNIKNYHRYGGRSIIVYNEWLDNFQKFYNWAISNGWEKGLTIDRINNDGNYEPNNCRWVSIKENCNNKENNILITAFGEIKTIQQWVEDARCCISHEVLRKRIKSGWNTEEAIITGKIKPGPKVK